MPNRERSVLEGVFARALKEERDRVYQEQLEQGRRLLEKVIEQLTQFNVKRTKAEHLTSRISRKMLAHKIGIFISLQLGREPLHLEGLIQS